MILFPNCKINIGLNILSKREDGYHNLETIFYPVPLRDALEVIKKTGGKNENEAEFSSSGLSIEGNAADNLCAKAYRLLKKDFPQLPSVQMHLHKAIPMGAGIGGGSADAAFTLILLNKKFQLNRSTNELINYALQLGSDCPFFIINKPCYARGRGELMEEIQLDLSGYRLVLVNPGIHINTGQAFADIAACRGNKSTAGHTSLKELPSLPVGSWKEKATNDFEEPVFAKYPAIGEIKQALYAMGAAYASMTGSGSTVYGLFTNEKKIVSGFPESYLVKTILL
jgi:4-diphosphocytidyl-2-C-methyl-D-erythritol kinase